jgi:hypothetical protein
MTEAIDEQMLESKYEQELSKDDPSRVSPGYAQNGEDSFRDSYSKYLEDNPIRVKGGNFDF